MNQNELDRYLQELLNIGAFSEGDPSQNGLQVTNSGRSIVRIALAVDAGMQTIERAASQGADMLLVHHGLFWKQSPLVHGVHYNRLKALFDADMALYAIHLPLDAHPIYGNNAGLAELLGLRDVHAFGSWHGLSVGLQGLCGDEDGKGCSIDDVVQALYPIERKPKLLLFGAQNIKKVAIVSGAGASELEHAIEEGCDLLLTGEIKQATYHAAYDHGINVIAAGHYATEQLGVQRLGKKLENDFKMHSFFIDVPTGI